MPNPEENIESMRRKTDEEIRRIYDTIANLEGSLRSSIDNLTAQLSTMQVSFERVATNMENFQKSSVRPCQYHGELQRDFQTHIETHKTKDDFFRTLLLRVLSPIILIFIGALFMMYINHVNRQNIIEQYRLMPVNQVEEQPENTKAP